MPFFITLSFPNVSTWVSDMGRVARRVSVDVMNIAGRQMIQDAYEVGKRLFENEGASGGHGKWAQLSARYEDWKRQSGYGNKILVLTGKLKESLTSQTKESIAAVYRSGDVWHIKYGTTVTSPTGFDYPLYHQLGGDVKRTVPARRSIDPTERDIHEWMRIIQRQVVDSLSKWEKPFDRVKLDRPAWIDRGDYRNIGRK